MAEVFVFGSNLAGRHGKGAALTARQEHGAIYGMGEGRQGNSYAIPTKDEKLRVLSVAKIRQSVELFLGYAGGHPEDTFNVLPIGCGLAGYHPRAMGQLFRGHPANVILPEEFKPYV